MTELSIDLRLAVDSIPAPPDCDLVAGMLEAAAAALERMPVAATDAVEINSRDCSARRAREIASTIREKAQHAKEEQRAEQKTARRAR